MAHKEKIKKITLVTLKTKVIKQFKSSKVKYYVYLIQNKSAPACEPFWEFFNSYFRHPIKFNLKIDLRSLKNL